MRQLAALVAVFAIISNHAWAFDHSPEAVGQVYFSIPFGAPTKQEATAHMGFRVAYGDELTFADHNDKVTFTELDWRSNLDGHAALLLNGVEVVPLSRSFSAAEADRSGCGGVVEYVACDAWFVVGLIMIPITFVIMTK